MTLKLEQPYSYTSLAHRLTLRSAADLSGRRYVWLEAENLAGRTVTVTSVWLRLDQVATLRKHLAAGTRYETMDHTGDRLIVRPGVETVVEVTRRPVVGEAAATVRVRVPSDRLPELRTALAATAEQAQQRTGASS
ncbi:hypothetical protein K4B79_18830 [Streptomyces lincolnensis]|uniref:hypothetical protein n=1 Tax=Streptomyces lincolnensis TaxID=1915 RepID=UPI001E40AEC7|nr:hypothetical protein [Streptomyces lincolnensis]MCD7440271.1 hypothetical protein [Streptomyces lincolnensis]